MKWSGDEMGQCEARAGTEGKCGGVQEDEGGEGRRGPSLNGGERREWEGKVVRQEEEEEVCEERGP